MRPLAAEIEWTKSGMRVGGTSLFLDSRRPQPLSFVSHAHSDHVAAHRQIIATAATAAALTLRLGRRPATLTPPYGQTFDLGALRLSLHPAGHIRGSAQLLIQREGRRLVYTGDLGLSASLTAEAAEVVPCDVLVMEATFGHPRFRLPTRRQALADVDAFIDRAHANGEVPILLAYALGKAQEVIAHLGQSGRPVRADGRIRAMTQVYRDFGCNLTLPELFEGSLAAGEVLIVSPFGRKDLGLRALGRRRSAILTGWAVEPGAARRYRADEAIALSDHADFDGLVQHAIGTGARWVYTVHGHCAPLAEALRARGIWARPLAETTQLELFE